jgi:hypothetical protein
MSHGSAAAQPSPLKFLLVILGLRIDTAESLVGTASSQIARELAWSPTLFRLRSDANLDPMLVDRACQSPLQVLLPANVNVRSRYQRAWVPF